MNNLPVDVMRAKDRGPVIGVDVGTDPTFTTDVEATEVPSFWKLFRGRSGRRRRPTSCRSCGAPAWSTARRRRTSVATQSDLLLTPPLESLDLLDWKAFERAIDIGYRDACERLAGGALAELGVRRRQAIRGAWSTGAAGSSGSTAAARSPTSSRARPTGALDRREAAVGGWRPRRIRASRAF